MGTAPNLPDDPTIVNVTAFRWSLGEPRPPLERVDLLTFDEHELLTYCRDLQQETTWLRVALSEALALLHRLTRQADRYRTRLDALLAELRRLRAGRHAL